MPPFSNRFVTSAALTLLSGWLVVGGWSLSARAEPMAPASLPALCCESGAPSLAPGPGQSSAPEPSDTLTLEQKALSKADLAKKSQHVPEMTLVHRRKRSDLNHIYQFDRHPLGNRLPVILLPGRAEEFQHNSWWKGFRQASEKNPYFKRYFKLYAYIYDSTQELDVQAADFKREVRLYFSDLPKNQPMMLVVYSLGGVIAREALADEDLLNRVDTVIAIAVPFHGSPLFDPDWFAKYLRPPNRSPVRKAWDRLIYRAYMFNKNNLTRGLRWDNFDSSKPQFEPNKIDVAGDQIIPKVSPYKPYPQSEAMKRKMIVYGSYMENGYTHGNQPINPSRLPKYVLENSLALPKEVVASVLPFYGFSVHSVFTYMNHQLSNIPTFTPEDPQGRNTHLYRYNDGAIPLSSMLFLPPSDKPYDQELDGLVARANCRKVRVFVNIDHMHIGDYTMFKDKLVKPDVVNPQDGQRGPHQWIMYDLINRVEFGMEEKPAVLATPQPVSAPE